MNPTDNDFVIPESKLAQDLKRQVDVEEERLKIIRKIRQDHPLFMEDHDFLYRCIAITSKGKGNFPPKSFFAGPSAPMEGTAGCSLQLHMKTKEMPEEPITPKTPQVDDGQPPSKRSRLQTALSELRETYTCTICACLMHNPTTLPCGHSACLICLKRAFRFQIEDGPRKCPLCKLAMPASLKPDQMVVNIVLRDTIQLLFRSNPDEGVNTPASTSTEVPSTVVDVEKIIDVLCDEFGLISTNEYNDGDIDNDDEEEMERELHQSRAITCRTQLIATAKNIQNVEKFVQDVAEDEIIRKLALNSPQFAYRVKKESALQHCSSVYADTVSARREAIVQTLLTTDDIEKFSQLPRPVFDTMIQQMHRNKIPLELMAFTTAHPANEIDLGRAADDNGVILSRFIPDHQLAQCFRRARKRFTSMANPLAMEDSDECYSIVREKCWNELLVPLLKSAVHIAHVAPSSESTAAAVRLVTVNDILLACECHYPNPMKVYGFGHYSGMNGLLAPAIIQVLKELSAECSIDEIALSVMHDMILSLAVDVAKCATMRATALTSGFYYDKRKGVPVYVTQTEIPLIDGFFQNGSAVFQTDTKSSEDSGLLGQFPLRLVTLDNVIEAMHSMLQGELLPICISQMDRAIAKYVNSTDKTASSTDICGLKFSPELIWSILQTVCGPLNTTMEVVIGVAAMMEYFTFEVLELANNATEDDIIHCITPRHVSLVISFDDELRPVFSDMIRHCCVKHDATFDPLYVPEELKEESNEMYGRIQRFLKKLYDERFEAGDPFFNPLNGSIVFTTANDFDDQPYPQQLYVLEALTKVANSSSTSLDNVFQRRLEGIQSLTPEQRTECEAICNSKTAQWYLRGRDVHQALKDIIQGFDAEEMYGLFQYAMRTMFPKDEKPCHITLEACELLGFLLECHVMNIIKA